MSTFVFRLLGSLEIGRRTPVRIHARKQRILLATLLLEANRTVTAEELIQRLWEDEDGSPAHERGALQVHVTRLRRRLAELAGESSATIHTRPEGYLLEVPVEEVDLSWFRVRAAEARRLQREGDPEAEARLLADALSSWRGRPLADLAGDSLQRDHVPGIVAEYLLVLERRFELDLHLGRHARVIEEIRAATTAHPLRERLWEHLIVALHRDDRQAEALEAYREIRRILADELGVDPGAKLVGLYQGLLQGSPDLPAGPRAVVTAGTGGWTPQFQLPSDVGAFVGRADDVAEVARLLGDGRPDGEVPADGVPVVALTGPPGIGKSALAVHVAHRLRPVYDDGQWYVRMTGSEGGQRTSAAVLGELLRFSGVPADGVPEDPDARAALYRSRLNDRRVLLVLEDADPSDVAPLIPGAAGCGVLVTSRTEMSALAALHGARTIRMGRLSGDEVRELFGRLLGPVAEADPGAVAELAELCGFLPLALRVAAANLAARPDRDIGRYVEELREGNLLSKLTIGHDGAGVRAAFDLSYDALEPPARRVFRLLGSVPLVELPAAAVVAVSGSPDTGPLDRLADAHLVERQPGGRYRMHDLLRAYAAERARSAAEDGEDAPGSAEGALDRLLGWYVRTALAAMDVYQPGLARVPLPRPPPDGPAVPFASAATARTWLDTERPNIVQLVGDPGPDPDGLRWHLADVVRGHLWAGRHYRSWLAVAATGRRAAERAGDRVGVNAMLYSAGLAHRSLGHREEADELMRHALAGFEATGPGDYEVAALCELGSAATAVGELAEALELSERARRRAVALDLPHGVGRCLRVLGAARHALGELDTARDYLERALEADRAAGIWHAVPETLRRLGAVLTDLGDADGAERYLHRALTCSDEVGERSERSAALAALSVHAAAAGRVTEAVVHGRDALAAARVIEDPIAEACAQAALGGALRTAGRAEQAAEHLEHALRLARYTGSRVAEVGIRIELSRLHLERDDTGPAREHAGQALSTATGYGLMVLRAEALAVLAAVALREADVAGAGARLAEALAVHAATGLVAGTPELHEVAERIGALEASASARGA